MRWYKARTFRRLVLMVLLACLCNLGGRAAAAPPALIGHDGAVDAQASSTAETVYFRYRLLKHSVALWADGRGDVILERTLENVNLPNWADTTWYFDWSPGNYSQIRAWDDSGPLQFSTSQSGTRIYVTVKFRQPVQLGQSYHFNLGITIGNMASGAGNNWQAIWYTIPGQPIQEYIQAVTFPTNAAIQSISPAVTTRRGNYVEWRYTDTPSNWQHLITVPYTLSDLTEVPLFLQTSQPWNDDAYGSYADGDSVNSIGKWGCFMTAAAMIINYHAIKSGAAFSTDPGAFNNWLRARKLYDGNYFVEASAVTYASEHGVTLSIPKPGRIDKVRDTTTDQTLDDSLKSGNPVILVVNAAGSASGIHFVVATGKTVANGVDTYAINDPIFGRTTLAEKYGNVYTSMRLFSGTQAEKRVLNISAHSPVELLVIDPLGRKQGVDPSTGISWNQIPDATYTTDAIAPDGGLGPELPEPVKSLFIYQPLDGDYSVQVHGTGAGTYSVNLFAANWRGHVTKQAFVGTAQPGSIDTHAVTYSSYTGWFSPYVFLPVARS